MYERQGRRIGFQSEFITEEMGTSEEQVRAINGQTIFFSGGASGERNRLERDPIKEVPLTDAGYKILLALADQHRYAHGIKLEVMRFTGDETLMPPGTFVGAITPMLHRGYVDLVDVDRNEESRRRGEYYGLMPFGRKVARVESGRLSQISNFAAEKGLVLENEPELPESAAGKDPRDLLPLTATVYNYLVTIGNDALHAYGIGAEASRLTNDPNALKQGTLYGSVKRMLEASFIEALPSREPTMRRGSEYKLTEFGKIAAHFETRRIQKLLEVAKQREL